MLPYSPLHHLLAGDAGVPLVMTSGNVSDEPIAFDDDDARARLGAIADRLLLHDRPIAHAHRRLGGAGRDRAPAAADAPLARLRAGRARPAGRGAAPAARLRRRAEEHLLPGARARRAWVGHHIGDLKNWETLRSFRDGVAHFERLFAVAPEVVAHDLHPDYLSTRYALEREGVELVAVQHHHAHLAACLAEHGEDGAGGRGDLRRHRLRRRTGRSGAGSCWSAGCAASSASGTCGRSRLPGGDARGPRAVADGRAPGWSRRGTRTSRRSRRRWPARSRPTRWRAVCGLARGAGRGAGHDERRPAVRRGRRALRARARR